LLERLLNRLGRSGAKIRSTIRRLLLASRSLARRKTGLGRALIGRRFHSRFLFSLRSGLRLQFGRFVLLNGGSFFAAGRRFRLDWDGLLETAFRNRNILVEAVFRSFHLGLVGYFFSFPTYR
jgi:hypothetical protein